MDMGNGTLINIILIIFFAVGIPLIGLYWNYWKMAKKNEEERKKL
jgi:cytochrome bd-type quinol oxidase subunit 2